MAVNTNNNKVKVIMKSDEMELEDKEYGEIKENNIKSVPEVPVVTVDQQSECFDEHVRTECLMELEECLIDKTEVAQEKVPVFENLKIKLKQSKKKPKTGKKLVLNSEIDNEIENIASQSDGPAEVKKSYSSVIKANLVKASNNNNYISSQPKVETVSSPAVQTTAEQEPGNWEEVSLSVSKPENWEKISKRKKYRNKKFEDSTLPEEMPGVEVGSLVDKSETPVEVEKVVACQGVLEESTVKDEIEQEKKKLRRRKKKYRSEEPEERRVVIFDEQIEIRYFRSVRRASEVLSKSLLDKVKTSGYCDFLFVSQLGLGISRGCMGLGRPYQGMYVPPERTDGLPELEEKECVEDEASGEGVIEDSCIKASSDIDID
eukprot:GFUD01044024.1.p1 GENE.GFUD01044024.1~~GFUD01044024.1.p1  ORF type:complete len:415 (+),score=133.94 GFUD01044024.1:122-1246(+)